MSDLLNKTYDVTINNIGPISEGFLDNDPYYLKVPLPTTSVTAIRKAKAFYRWRFMILKLSEFATIKSITNIAKTGTNLHDNAPSTISFRITFDQNFSWCKVDDENSGPFFAAKLTVLSNPGTGYQPGDILTLSGGTTAFTGSTAQFKVLNTTQTGVITSLEQIDLGYYTSLPTIPASLTGGTGSGASIIFKSIENPGLRGRYYIRRQIANALLYEEEDVTFEIYDPTPTAPYHPNTKPLIARYPQRVINEDFVALAPNLAAAEAAITVTIV